MWLRDGSAKSPCIVTTLFNSGCSLYSNNAIDTWVGVRPAFTIDLSKVNATVVDTVKYK